MRRGSGTYEFTAIETTYKKPTQAKAREQPSMEKGDGHEVPPLSNTALATDRCWEKKSEFSLRNTPKLICKDICGLSAPT